MSSFGSESSVKALEWLRHYKRLSQKPFIQLNAAEKQVLKDLEHKLAYLLNPKDAPSHQKREFLRVPTTLSAELADLHYDNESAVRRAYVRNISGGGLFVETDRIPAMGSQVSFNLVVKTPPQILKLSGTVAWTNPSKSKATPQGFGLKFGELSSEDQKKLQSIVALQVEQVVIARKPNKSASDRTGPHRLGSKKIKPE